MNKSCYLIFFVFAHPGGLRRLRRGRPLPWRKESSRHGRLPLSNDYFLCQYLALDRGPEEVEAGRETRHAQLAGVLSLGDEGTRLTVEGDVVAGGGQEEATAFQGHSHLACVAQLDRSHARGALVGHSHIGQGGLGPHILAPLVGASIRAARGCSVAIL